MAMPSKRSQLTSPLLLLLLLPAQLWIACPGSVTAVADVPRTGAVSSTASHMVIGPNKPTGGTTGNSTTLAAKPTAKPVNKAVQERLRLLSAEQDGDFLSAQDSGVGRCTFMLPVPAGNRTHITQIHYFIKYTHWRGHVSIRGFGSGDTRTLRISTASGRAAPISPALYTRPTLVFRKLQADPATVLPFNISSMAYLSGTHGVQDERQQQPDLRVPTRIGVHSYWDPPARAAMVYSFQADLLVDTATHGHEYSVFLDEDTLQTCTFKPAKMLNLLDGRGMNVPPMATPGQEDTYGAASDAAFTATSGTAPSGPAALRGAVGNGEVMVVIRPLAHLDPYLFASLLERHVAYHAALGTTRHIVYIRRRTLLSLLNYSAVIDAVRRWRVLLVLWDEIHTHDGGLGSYDQRIVRSHAALALSGTGATLLMLDLDEYIVTPHAQLPSLRDVLRLCSTSDAGARLADAATPSPAPVGQLQIPRLAAICSSCDATRPELPLWMDKTLPAHPLHYYDMRQRISRALLAHKQGAEPAAAAAITSPALPVRAAFSADGMRVFYSHTGSLRTGYSDIMASERCISLLHITNLLRPHTGEGSTSSSSSTRARRGFVMDYTWQPLLRRLEEGLQAAPGAESHVLRSFAGPQQAPSMSKSKSRHAAALAVASRFRLSKPPPPPVVDMWEEWAVETEEQLARDEAAAEAVAAKARLQPWLRLVNIASSVIQHLRQPVPTVVLLELER